MRNWHPVSSLCFQMQLAPLHNGYVMPEEYFTECHVVIEHLDVMIRMLGRVVTHSRV